MYEHPSNLLSCYPAAYGMHAYRSTDKVFYAPAKLPEKLMCLPWSMSLLAWTQKKIAETQFSLPDSLIYLSAHTPALARAFERVTQFQLPMPNSQRHEYISMRLMNAPLHSWRQYVGSWQRYFSNSYTRAQAVDYLELQRLSGQALFYQQGSVVWRLAFSELIAAEVRIETKTQRLLLASSEGEYFILVNPLAKWSVTHYWQYLLRVMDTSQALPTAPQFLRLRCYDPISVRIGS